MKNNLKWIPVFAIVIYIFGSTFVTLGYGEQLLNVTCNTDNLKVYGETKFNIFSAQYTVYPTLVYNGKKVSGSRDSYPEDYLQISGFTPILPEFTKNLEYKIYDAANSARWNVYVDPDLFSKEEFTRLVACYEAYKPSFDAVITQVMEWRKIKKFGFVNGNLLLVKSIVYSKELPPIYFSCPEGVRMQIQPDARWAVINEEILGSGKYDIALRGSIGFDQSNTATRETFLTEGKRNPDFFKGCVRDSDGERLDSIYDYKVSDIGTKSPAV